MNDFCAIDKVNKVKLKKGTPSNSVPEGRNSTLFDKSLVKMSIDRLSFTAKIANRNEIDFLNGLSVNPYVDLQNTKTSLAEGNAYDKALTRFSYDKFSPFPSGSNLRIELNPNNFEDDYFKDYQETFLNHLFDSSLTRIDIAFDIPCDLSTYYFYLQGIRKQAMHLDGRGKLETHYLGTRNSDRYVRLYNKKLELMQNHGKPIESEHLWRLEIQLSNDWVNKWEQCLSGLSLMIPDCDLLEGDDYFYIPELIKNPQSWDKLSDYKRKKYRKSIKEMPSNSNLLPILSQALVEYKSQLELVIRDYSNLGNDELFSRNKVRHDSRLPDEYFEKFNLG